jgi:tRNA (cytosine49-C5)-methyltransferase
MKVKSEFKERYTNLLGNSYEEFIDISSTFLRKSIRANTIKIKTEELAERLQDNWILEQIPWCKDGFWIKNKEKRIDVGNAYEHLLGYYYVQEAASMIPPVVLDAKPGETVLDMCASPGSKTSQIAQNMKNQGCIVANDVSGLRIAPLGINLQRCGVMNTVITISDARKINNQSFDRVLADAPCSGTGTIRKSLKTLTMWNPGMVRNLVGQQRRILEAGYNNLKDSGTLVYSTCTLEPEENEGVVSWFLQKYPEAKIQPIKLKINRSPCITKFNNQEYDSDVEKCLRIWPQDNDSEGFFVCKITN